MTIKQYIITILMVTLLCWGGFIMVIFFINPETATTFSLSFFYLSLFLALIGTLSLVSYIFRLIFSRLRTKSEKVEVSFRQAIFFSAIVCLALFLQSQKLLNLFNIVLLVLVVSVIEFLIISLKKNHVNESASDNVKEIIS